MMMRVSLILPWSRRSRTMPQTFTERPVAGYTQEIASARAGPLEPGQHFVALGNLLFDGEMQVWKRRPHPSQYILQSIQAGALAWERNLLHHILPDELRDGVNFPEVDAFFDEAADYGTVGFRRHGSPLRAYFSLELYRRRIPLGEGASDSILIERMRTCALNFRRFGRIL